MFKFTGRLKFQLFISPVLLLGIAFLSLYLAFNIAMTMYIEKITSNSINEEFRYIDAYYSDSDEIPLGDFSPEYDYLLPIFYIIVNSNGDPLDEILYTSQNNEAVERELLQEYLREHTQFLTSGSRTKLALGKHYFYVKIREFPAKSSDLLRPNPIASSKIFSVVYVDITPIQSLHRFLHLILSILMLIIAIPTLAYSFFTNKQLDRAFSKLTKCIESAGKREPIHSSEHLGYMEFQELQNTILHMSGMIDAAESSRKIFFRMPHTSFVLL